METLFELLGKSHLRKLNRLEKSIGYKLVLPKLSDKWIDGYVRIDLSKHCRKFGLNATVIDYFSMGKIVDGVSTRFDPKALEYQAWIGGYLVKHGEAKPWTLQNHFDLAVVDQTGWLKDYGDPSPFFEFHAEGMQEIGDTRVGSYQGKIYIGGGFSHGDVGNRNHFKLRFVGNYLATFFNLSNSELHLKNTNFITRRFTPYYHPLYLKGYIIILDIGKGVKAVLYANGAVFKDQAGKEVNTFESLKKELLDDLMRVSIVKL